MINCGFIAPDGTYYTCGYMEHLWLAERICKENGWIEEIKKYIARSYPTGLDYEEFLFSKGYLEIASRYVSHSCMRGASIGDTDFPHIHLSEKQKEFLQNNLENANNEEQVKWMMDLLEFDEDVDEYNEWIEKYRKKRKENNNDN